MSLAPKDLYYAFIDGEGVKEIARKNDTEPEFVEAIIRAVAVGIELARPRCQHDGFENE